MKALLAVVAAPAIAVIGSGVIAIGSSAGVTGSTGTAGNGDVAASSYAKGLIPPNILAIEQSASVKAECPGLSWTILGAITHLESDDGRNKDTSPQGAVGPDQFLPTTWDKAGQLTVTVGVNGQVPTGQGYGVDGDGDGIADIRDPADSIAAAARYLCANGGGNVSTLPKAIYAYNHVWWYVYGGDTGQGTTFEGVLPLAAKLGSSLAVSPTSSNARATVIQAAASQLGVFYSFGGGNASGPTTGQCSSDPNDLGRNDCNVIGWDCSGLVLYAYNKVGEHFPHLAAAQYYETRSHTVTTDVNDLSRAQPGDLVFFEGAAAPGHVGIYIGNGYMIDAPYSTQKVRVDSIHESQFVAITDPFAAKAGSE